MDSVEENNPLLLRLLQVEEVDQFEEKIPLFLLLLDAEEAEEKSPLSLLLEIEGASKDSGLNWKVGSFSCWEETDEVTDLFGDAEDDM